MHGLKIFTSNRMEILAGEMARIVKTPLLSPLEPEIIVVQSRGMERWLSMEIARHNGICANCCFPFPNTFLQEISGKIFPNLPDTALFEPALMTFRIMNILPGCMDRPGFESLKTYLTDDKDELKLFQLSEKISDTFDQYLVFRPEMIFAWEDGKADHWQAQLWRELSTAGEGMHRARLHRSLLEKIREAPDQTADLPRRVSVFGISYLPPFYIRLFDAISRVLRVNLFLMNPCEAYWADIVSDKEMKRIRGKYPGVEDLPALHLERGNRILASIGGQGRDFFSLVIGVECETMENFVAPEGNDLLSCIQSDILSLRDREGTAVFDEDTSLQIHACHSPMREIEVLHDNLLAMFEEDPDLLPKDILVMTPDIEQYAPFIHAVFDAETDDALRIPFSIADRSARAESGVIEGFLSMLELKESRLGANRVLSLLEFPGVKERFGLSASDMETIERWTRETQIRWGIDAESRRGIGLPAYPENTWRAGIERLLLGYAMPGDESRMFSGILPYDHIEGAEARTLGRFLEFFYRLIETADELKYDENLNGWSKKLNVILDKYFFLDEDAEPEIQVLRRVFDDMSEKQTLTGFSRKIKLEVILYYLRRCLDQQGFGGGFISSGVTFCAMLPMRSIPSQVICLVGMNNDAFPRDARQVGFDLIAAHPKPGDRSRRNDDRYLFLEALVSARKKLYISYVGQSIRDNSRRPPSVLVSEVIDYVADGFGIPGDKLVTPHRLQAFSPEYFKKGGRLFSYSRENFSADSGTGVPGDPPGFITSGILAPADEWKQLGIDHLCDFFRNPARFFLERRLGITLYEAERIVEERENFNLDGLTLFRIGQNLVKRRLADADLKAFLPLERAMGNLPHGTVGDVLYGELSVDAEAFVDKIRTHTKGNRLESLDVDVEIAGFRLRGRLKEVFDHGLVRIRYAKTKSTDLLGSWIYHLILCLAGDERYPRNSLFMGKDTAIEFDSMNNPLEILEELLAFYQEGLSRPIHFFPESSREYAQKRIQKDQPEQVALISAKNRWYGSDFSQGESLDPYYELCFNRTDPLDKSFQKISETVFEPLFAHSREIIL
ncbi:MAG: exodeoxyribonuclease V subunit gamma [Pseudomonadota bacterium]